MTRHVEHNEKRNVLWYERDAAQPSLSFFLFLLCTARISPKHILMMDAEISRYPSPHKIRPHHILKFISPFFCLLL